LVPALDMYLCLQITNRREGSVDVRMLILECSSETSSLSPSVPRIQIVTIHSCFEEMTSTMTEIVFRLLIHNMPCSDMSIFDV